MFAAYRRVYEHLLAIQNQAKFGFILIFWLISMIVLAACILVGTYLAYTLHSLYQNYVKASKIGLPVLINPIEAMNPLWFMSQELLHPLLIKLPFNLGEFATRLKSNWTFVDRYRHHAKYGAAFVEVTPSYVRIFCADPAAMEDISKRRNEFYKSPVIYSSLDIFGPNLDTVNGKVWERHKRVTVPPFNEKNSVLVWTSTIAQVSQMAQFWQTSDSVSSTQMDLFTVTLNVLCYAGFGVEVDFINEHDQELQDQTKNMSGKYGYRASIRILLANFITLILHSMLTTAGYPDKWMWGGMKRITQVKAEFKGYMQHLMDRETILFEQGNVHRHNLLSSLIRANLEARKGESEDSVAEKTQYSGSSSRALSQDEIYGNIFIYNFAGHDTTAGALNFALTLLSVHPELQEWLAEEIDAVRAKSDDPSFYYETTFPQLKRCLALMHETLRLYGPVQVLPRATPPDVTASLTIGDQTVIVPPDTQVIVNFSALHTHPKYWSPDPLSFRPSRFIARAADAEGSSSLAGEEFYEPSIPGTFVAWNRGQRICPGRKFSQVEFVAAVFVLFADRSRVRLAIKPGETFEQAKTRALKLVDDATIELTLKTNGSVDVEWYKKH